MQRVVVSLLAAASLFFACSGTSTTNGKYDQTQTAVTPKGSITARIIDGSNYQPLADVAITVVGSTATLTTDANGLATFSDAVVNSSYIFVAEKAGYLRQTTSSAVSGSSGNSPLAGAVSTFTLTLYKADATVKGFVFLPNGTPAKAATVYVDERNAGAGDAVATALTGADGSFMLTNIASRPTGFSYQIYALWFDENGDGQADYPSTNGFFTALPGQTARVFITYPNGLGQKVIGSNVLDGSVLPATDLTFQFALPVQNTNFNGAAANAFTLTNLTRNANVAVTATWTSDTAVNVKPVAALAVGERYTIAISVTNANAQPSNANPNFNVSYTFQVRPDGSTAITSQVTNLSLQNQFPINSSAAALTQYDYNSNNFKLQWDSVGGAVSYSIYAKDTKLNPDWVFVQSVTATGGPRMVATNVFLGAGFDMLPSSGGTDPLAGGNVVTFTVVATDIYGNVAPLATSPTATAADNIQPSWTSGFTRLTTSPIYGTVDAINDDALPSQWLFRISSSEPMDPASPPLFTGSGSPATTWSWDAFNFAFTMTLTIQPGIDNTGNFLIRGGKDSSGNLITNGDIQGSLSGYKELLTHGTFEDATGCTVAGWSPNTSGSMSAASAILGTGLQTGRCAAVFGAPNGGSPATGVSRLAQDITLPSLTGQPNWTFIARVVTRGVVQSGGSNGYQSCRITDTLLAENVLSSLAGSTAVNSASNFGLSAGQTTSTFGANSTVRLICEVSNNAPGAIASNTSLYVDDASFVLAKIGTY